MDPERRAWLRGVLVTMDVVVLVALWWVVPDVRAWLVGAWPFDLVPDAHVLRPLDPADARAWGLVLVPVWLAALHLRGLWNEPVPRASFGAVAGACLGAAVAGLATLALVKADVSRTVLAGYAVASCLGLHGVRSAVGMAARRWEGAWNVVLVGPEHAVELGGARLARHPELGVSVVGRVVDQDVVPGVWRQVCLGAVDEVRVCGAVGGELEALARLCSELGMTLRVEPTVWGPAAGAEVSLRFARNDPAGMVAKRVFDVVVGGVLCLLVAPVVAVLAGLVWAFDGGTPWFIQERVGLHGRRFSMWKLRTMSMDADRQRDGLDAFNETGGAAFKMRDDPRVTGIGRVLRRWSLDELPQLFHVVVGSMSLVGPRPAIASEVADYEREERRRLAMRPGLTCIWQVSGRSDLDWSTWMEMDLAYVDGWSFGLDLALLMQTVPAVLSGRGAR